MINRPSLSLSLAGIQTMEEANEKRLCCRNLADCFYKTAFVLALALAVKGISSGKI